MPDITYMEKVLLVAADEIERINRRMMGLRLTQQESDLVMNKLETLKVTMQRNVTRHGEAR